MGARSFEPKAGWKSPVDDLVNDFYRPALKNCVQYDRLTGFFNSNTFAAVIHETLDFVERGGRMRLITSATFSKADLDVITKSVEDQLLEEVSVMLKDDLGKKCLSIFGHMLTNKIDDVPQLEIKILVSKRGIFHPKVGIFTMSNGDMVSFSGSINETGMGWTGNIEEFKAFCSWIDEKYVNLDIDTFREFWYGSHAGIRTYDLPKAVHEKILSIRPESDEEYRRLILELQKTMYGNQSNGSSGKFKLRDYQEQAITTWTSHGYKGILEMPTATGKTFTALGCVNRLQREQRRLFTVIAVPYKHLAQQWIDNVSRWNKLVLPEQRISNHVLNTADNSKWKIQLRRAVAEFNKKKFSGSHVINDYIVCTTYDTLPNKEFIDVIKGVDESLLLVADEAHHAGSTVCQTGLLEEYSSRLALTATPERYFDKEGSELLKSYFGDIVYSIDMDSAIKGGYLTQYDYYPVFAKLNSVELTEYRKLTRAIAQKLSKRKNEEMQSEDVSNIPENKRARLIAKIENKYEALASVLDKHDNVLENALIYCHDTEQLRRVGEILTKRNINYDEITQASGMMDRRDKIRSLAAKNHQCIIAMKCLDEGVDIPSARLGIIMASTGNPLQYIQRRGRLLRLADGKSNAVIYDMLADVPPDTSEQSYVKKLVAKELLRHKEFAQNARNKDEAIDMIRPTATKLGIEVDKLDLDYVRDL